jgi:hypothetical protein
MKYFRKRADRPTRSVFSRRGAAWVAVLAGVLGMSRLAVAHHSFAMFDMAKTVTVDGTVKQFQWTNPHVWIEVLVATPDGPKQYSIEGTAIRVLKGAGWTFKSLEPGDKVTVVMNPLRSGEAGGSLVSVKLQDGRMLSAF